MVNDEWIPAPTAGAELLDDVETFLSRFVAYPSEHARVAHVLWIGHCWFMDVWESTPRIAFLSPEPGSGKSRALEVTEPLVPRPVHAVNASPSALFRTVSDPNGAPTILFDEVDTIFGPKAKDNEDLRGLLNAGHRRGATTLRAVVRGKEIAVEEFPAYCAVALAGLDDLPDTIMTRSVIVRMRRRAPGERVEPWRRRVNGPEALEIQARLLEWSNANQHAVDGVWPEMPVGVEDRNADVWEALLAVADLAGGDWPDRARVAAVTAVTDSREAERASIGVMLLRDIRAAFAESQTDRMTTVDLLDYLNDLEDSPWGDIRGKALDARGLSRRLGKYGIKPATIRVGTSTAKGYISTDAREGVESLADAWQRYVPPVPHHKDEEIPPPRITEHQAPVALSGSADPVTPVTPVTGGEPVGPGESATSATPLRDTSTCSGVADVADESANAGATLSLDEYFAAKAATS